MESRLENHFAVIVSVTVDRPFVPPPPENRRVSNAEAIVESFVLLLSFEDPYLHLAQEKPDHVISNLSFSINNASVQILHPKRSSQTASSPAIHNPQNASHETHHNNKSQITNHNAFTLISLVPISTNYLTSPHTSLTLPTSHFTQPTTSDQPPPTPHPPPIKKKWHHPPPPKTKYLPSPLSPSPSSPSPPPHPLPFPPLHTPSHPPTILSNNTHTQQTPLEKAHAARAAKKSKREAIKTRRMEALEKARAKKRAAK